MGRAGLCWRRARLPWSLAVTFSPTCPCRGSTCQVLSPPALSNTPGGTARRHPRYTGEAENPEAGGGVTCPSPDVHSVTGYVLGHPVRAPGLSVPSTSPMTSGPRNTGARRPWLQGTLRPLGRPLYPTVLTWLVFPPATLRLGTCCSGCCLFIVPQACHCCSPSLPAHLPSLLVQILQSSLQMAPSSGRL